jgi:hypothetical protein
MKAIRIHNYGGPEVLQYEDVAEPSPGPAELLIKVAPHLLILSTGKFEPATPSRSSLVPCLSFLAGMHPGSSKPSVRVLPGSSQAMKSMPVLFVTARTRNTPSSQKQRPRLDLDRLTRFMPPPFRWPR